MHLLAHCRCPIELCAKCASCSSVMTGSPLGAALEPFLNWPERKMPHVQGTGVVDFASTFFFSSSCACDLFVLCSSLPCTPITTRANNNKHKPNFVPARTCMMDLITWLGFVVGHLKCGYRRRVSSVAYALCVRLHTDNLPGYCYAQVGG